MTRPMNTDAGSQAVQILEATYETARLLAPDLPPVAFTIKASGRRRASTVLGHFAPGRYSSNGAPLHEVCVTGDTISRGAESLLTTVLHEAVHALASARGIKDTSRQNRYHNTRFRALAETFHLTYDLPENYADVPDKRTGEIERKLVPDQTIGFSNVGLTPNGQLFYAGILDVLVKDFPFDLGTGQVTPTKPRRVLHGYVAPFDRWSRQPVDLIQIAPSRYRALRPYLQGHNYTESTADEDFVLHVLYDYGIVLPDKAPSNNYRYGWDELHAEHPELITFADEIKDSYS